MGVSGHQSDRQVTGTWSEAFPSPGFYAPAKWTLLRRVGWGGELEMELLGALGPKGSNFLFLGLNFQPAGEVGLMIVEASSGWDRLRFCDP